MDERQKYLGEVVEALRNADWELHRSVMAWSLNPHRCRDFRTPTCEYAEKELCPYFERWKEDGKDLLVSSPRHYEETVRREEDFRQRRKNQPPSSGVSALYLVMD
jgi:hypothetical protein